MGMTTGALNLAVNAMTGVITYVSLHNGNPGTNGANEISGGTYARQTVSWNAASGGSGSASNQPTFGIPAGTTVMYLGFWSAVSGGTFYGSGAVTNETYAASGTYTATSITISAT